MLIVEKMPLKGEVSGHALNSPGNNIVYHEKSWNHVVISPFIYSNFFLSNENFCRRSLGSYWSQCFQILCTPSGRLSVLCK